MLAYFGYPQAYEDDAERDDAERDDAERAVRAGLGAIETVRRTEVKSIDLQARVGIATGLLVVGDLPVLLVVTFRPHFQPSWTGRPQVSLLALNRLDRHDRTALVAQIAGGKVLLDEVVERIAERTGGVPLFIEELTESVSESGLSRSLCARFRFAAIRDPGDASRLGFSPNGWFRGVQLTHALAADCAVPGRERRSD